MRGLLLLLALACGCEDTRKQTKPTPVCSSTEELGEQARTGSLRKALALAEDRSFCAPDSAAVIKVGVLVELGRYDEASRVLDTVDRTGETDRLRMQIATRSRPRSAAELARARALETRLLTMPTDSPGEWLALWEAAPPHGLALIHAGLLTARIGPRRDEIDPAAQRLFERGVAELEAETGRAAHAGVRSRLLCTGHFGNHLEVRWLDAGIHAP